VPSLPDDNELPTDDLADEIFDELNAVRMEPTSLIANLDVYAANFNGNTVTYNGVEH